MYVTSNLRMEDTSGLPCIVSVVSQGFSAGQGQRTIHPLPEIDLLEFLTKEGYTRSGSHELGIEGFLPFDRPFETTYRQFVSMHEHTIGKKSVR